LFRLCFQTPTVVGPHAKYLFNFEVPSHWYCSLPHLKCVQGSDAHEQETVTFTNSITGFIEEAEGINRTVNRPADSFQITDNFGA